MPEIAITAAIANGSAVLFEAPSAGTLRLPRCTFGPEHEEIEDALTAHLKDRLGIEATDQQFVDTVFERKPGASETLVNNLQLVAAWEGEVPARDAIGLPLRWVPYAELSGVGLAPDLEAALLTALGVPQSAEDETLPGAVLPPGRIIVLTGPDDAQLRLVAHQLPATLGRCAVVEMAAVRGFLHPSAADTPDAPGFPALMRRVRALGLQNAVLLAGSISSAGFDAVIAGTVAGPEEIDALVAGLLGTRLYLVQLTQPGWRSDARGLRLDTGAAGTQDIAGRIVAQLESGRLS